MTNAMQGDGGGSGDSGYGGGTMPHHLGSSRIFCPQRALGYVSNHVAAVMRYHMRRKDNIITTCIGRAFQVYTSNHFRLILVSRLHSDEITAMATDRHHVYTACNGRINAWQAGKHLRHVYRGHDKDVRLLLPFGQHLIAVDDSNVLRMWDIASEEVYVEIPFGVDEFKITAIAHPPTYINKIVLGSQQGRLQIWNLKENRLVYTFAAAYDSRVTCLEPSPALDVMAVGYQDGTIRLLNLKYDEELMSFKQDWGAVTRLTFRTDGPPIMVSASANGHLAFWNLEEQKISNQLQAHESAIATAICFVNEPLMLTTSSDNSMKLWIFDMPDGGARLLRIREGHTAPPLCIRYHGTSGNAILSAGEDSSLRVFSTISESLNKSMGKASYNRKSSKRKNRFQEDSLRMPPIIDFTSEITREIEWDNIAAIHAGIVQTTTWSFHKNRMGEHRLLPERLQNRNREDFLTETTCLTLTHCGNFVIIGYSNGHLERFNIQSGIHRASYGPPAHKSAVRGVVSDVLNQFVVSGCSDGLLKFWCFKENVEKPACTMTFPDGITLMRLHRESAMIAIAFDSFDVHVVDLDTKIIIRKFEGHTSKINDLTFSPDSRWLITAAMDASIKVWDIPSSYMIDHFRADSPCISLSMSPNGDFLATAHVDFLGIYLWANKTIFNYISLRSLDPTSEAPYVHLPANMLLETELNDAMNELSMDVDVNGDDDDGEDVVTKYESPEQISNEFITLACLPVTRWQTLLNLDTIKKRNKPKTALTVPKQAPFFLPTVAGLDLKFNITAQPDEEDSKLLKSTTMNNLTIFGKMLEEATTNDDYAKCFEYLKKFGPSMIDFEIKSLHPLSGGTCLAMVQFLKCIEHTFTTNANFEVAQSYLSAFLRAHGLNLLQFPEVIETLKHVSAVQKESWQRLEAKLMYGLGVVAALRNFAH